MDSIIKKLLLGATAVGLTMAAVSAPAYAAGDMSGIHAFFNDDRNQFVDFWLNNNGRVTIKASNGRPWSPMWVTVHATFMSGGQVLGRKDYHVYASSPVPGGGGSEKWFLYGNPGFSGVTSVVVTTNKEKPWGKPEGGWEIEISGSTKF
ncbi:hypothetical protein CI1B_27730 [Bradyrhizobium ivorense]|uniref:Uncharacterized protein n=1 Tax=Bradyrhizobium ivorense TaxID=2511166 RepID=A0A508T8N3_9BRAD|nr:hypothetical protein [Bradyrhizobium ivorense]VIO69567.1 hypothetical protein CI1B_27730 [Bradyrhizobium ivorense]VIO71313.1 hypothetical protein CI41S_29840 [Bradyrhizobium ivorense]